MLAQGRETFYSSRSIQRQNAPVHEMPGCAVISILTRFESVASLLCLPRGIDNPNKTIANKMNAGYCGCVAVFS